MLSREWVQASGQVDSLTDPSAGCQHFWWIAAPSGRAHFRAEGRFGQFIYVVPDLDLVMVRLGRADGDIDWRRFPAGMARRVSVVDGTPHTERHDRHIEDQKPRLPVLPDR